MVSRDGAVRTFSVDFHAVLARAATGRSRSELAHTTKWAAASISAGNLAALAARMEQAAVNQHTTPMEALVQSLEDKLSPLLVGLAIPG